LRRTPDDQRKLNEDPPPGPAIGYGSPENWHEPQKRKEAAN
jgi:hypothetical protein